MSEQTAVQPCAKVIPFPRRNFHGAAIINDDGTETPITEEMVNQAVDQAIDQLINYLPNWLHPLSAPANS
ncbi:PA1571 family protein [uncultured Pseudoteredinibacter sp.]|uniref:PA1571 family protein n=1 Tax=uncultured Pseudoteredinibacter sp. TaxID=1641701 RepID=UPI0026398E52|nr:PA1571 family protein [uncultured Pseudoteredinibacter sp.]MCV6623978.1 hypothetical protein [Cellvibrionaceae bacterium]